MAIAAPPPLIPLTPQPDPLGPTSDERVRGQLRQQLGREPSDQEVQDAIFGVPSGPPPLIPQPDPLPPEVPLDIPNRGSTPFMYIPNDGPLTPGELGDYVQRTAQANDRRYQPGYDPSQPSFLENATRPGPPAYDWQDQPLTNAEDAYGLIKNRRTLPPAPPQEFTPPATGMDTSVDLGEAPQPGTVPQYDLGAPTPAVAMSDADYRDLVERRRVQQETLLPSERPGFVRPRVDEGTGNPFNLPLATAAAAAETISPSEPQDMSGNLDVNTALNALLPEYGAAERAIGGALRAARPTVELGARRAGRAVAEAVPKVAQAARELATSEEGAFRIPGTPPPATPPAPGGPLDKTLTMLTEAERGPGMIQKANAAIAALPDKYRAFQEAFTDRFAGLNALSPNVEKQIARLGGVGEAQAQRAQDIATVVKGALGELWPDAGKHLDAYLHLKQAIDINAVKGGGTRLIPGGIKGASEAQLALDELEKNLGPQRWRQLEAGANAAVKESQATLQYLVDNGLVSQNLANELIQKYPHYNKQNIIQAVADDISGAAGRTKVSVTSNNLKRLTEQGTEKGRTSPYSSIIGSAVDAEALVFRNRAAAAAAKEAIQQGIGKTISGTRPVANVGGTMVFRRPPGEIPNTISYMENGVRKVVEVPEWAAKEAQAIAKSGDPTILDHIGVLNSLPKSLFVTYNPAWPLANLASDYLTALITRGVTPLEEAKGLIGAVRDIAGNDPVLAQMRRSGGGQAGWFAPDARKVAEMVRKSGNLAIEDQSAWNKLLSNPLAFVGDVAKGTVTAPFRLVRTAGQVAEQGTRRAVFQTSLKRQGVKNLASASDTALSNAALAARRSTIDFARGGELAKQLNALSLFFNAGVQGTMLPFRALRDLPQARWALGTALGLNAGLYAYNRQFPEYDDVPAAVKRGSLIVMLPSEKFTPQGQPVPRYISVVPKTREWGAFFGTENYILEQLDQRQHESLGRFLSQQTAQATPLQGASAIAGLTTVPGEAALQQLTNQNFYQGRPIVPPELQGEPATEQYDAYTSDSIKRAAQAMGLSPLRLQDAFYSLTGGAGRALTSVTDPLLAHLNPKPVDFRIAQLAHELDQIKAPAVPPDEVALRRTEYLNSLSPKDRQAIMELARQPQPQTPIVSAIGSRFYGERGGELYRLGQEAAQEATGKSPEQTATVSKALGAVADKLDAQQAAQDAEFARSGDGAKWRDAHSNNATMYQGALLGLGVVFPGAAQIGDKATWTNYQNAVYTLAGQEQDRRTKGQILAAGYRAIPLDNLDPLTPDFKTFFQKREEYKAALNPDDRALLERTIEASMTPTEKEYAKAQDDLRPYWEIKDKITANNAGWAKIIDDYETALKDNSVRGKLYQKAYKNTFGEYIDLYNHSVEDTQDLMKIQHPEVDKALVKWYGATPIAAKQRIPVLQGRGR